MISRGPLILNAVLVAAPVDWSIWYMAQYMEGGRENQIWYLYASFTSWFNAYALIRTYSNSLETAILAIALCLVSPVGFFSVFDGLSLLFKIALIK
jgi:hypothetical protein